ncbi:MAG: hypothetical protein HY663_06435 [Chloroflexi bacterium]|nr:hypothetical protein [Chloroflexota bacterium]
MTKRLLVGISLVGVIAALAWLVLNLTANKPALSPIIVGSQERVRLITPTGEIVITTKIDTGADFTAIDSAFARSFGLEPTGRKMVIRTEEGTEERETTDLTFVLANRRITAVATLADRSGFSTRMIIGKDALAGFLVDASKEFLTKPEKQSGSAMFTFFGKGISADNNEPELAKVMIIIPILGAVIVWVRLLAGIRTFGMFAPVVIALSMLDLQILPGVLIYALLIVTGVAVKLLLLKRLQLPNIAELSLIIFALVLVLLGISALPFNFVPLFGDIFFRLIITTFVIEQASRTAEEQRMIDVLPLLLATFAAAVVLAYYGAFLLQKSFSVLWAVFAISAFASIIAGNYLGLRLTELIRFKFLRKTHVHQ